MTNPDRKTPINVQLLVDTLAQIELHPDTWNQGAWRSVPNTPDGDLYLVASQRCGAQLCFAGHVAAITGGKWVLEATHLQKMIDKGYDPNDYDTALAALKPTKEELDGDDVSDIYAPVFRKNRPGIGANERAKRLLGLTDDEAEILFGGSNTLWELRIMVAKLIMRAAEEAREGLAYI